MPRNEHPDTLKSLEILKYADVPDHGLAEKLSNCTCGTHGRAGAGGNRRRACALASSDHHGPHEPRQRFAKHAATGIGSGVTLAASSSATCARSPAPSRNRNRLLRVLHELFGAITYRALRLDRSVDWPPSIDALRKTRPRWTVSRRFARDSGEIRSYLVPAISASTFFHVASGLNALVREAILSVFRPRSFSYTTPS